MSNPIELYYWPTPNGHKITIFMEEAGLPYQVHPVDIGNGDQFKPDFLKLSPNNKMPAIVDPDGPDGKPLAIFESGAILMYLAEKTGKYLPASIRERYQVIEWLMFQMAGLGPMLGQAHHFRGYAPEKLPYAIERYTKEASRLYGVLDRRLAGQDYVAGEYSIADMAIYPWIISHERQGQNLADFPYLKRWFERVGARAAVQRGIAVLEERRGAAMSDKARQNLFGEAQYQKR
ncbi:MAG TPA: glutathione S-transferase N-terminal domain-containing protein, partial [Gammaproteobacteria bacterium]|jgi:GST-like protein|nr:glutathione S-transferase N-terminal domain-containing protein [Gammaproteobacteria bacterium]